MIVNFSWKVFLKNSNKIKINWRIVNGKSDIFLAIYYILYDLFKQVKC